MAFLLPALARFALPAIGRAIPFIGRAISSIGGMASKAIPKIASIGKSVLPKALSAIGKVQGGIEMGKAIGKQARQAVGSINPELGKQMDEAYNKKLLGGMSASDVLGRGENVLNKSKDLVENTKSLLANQLPEIKNIIDKSMPPSNYNSTNYSYS